MAGDGRGEEDPAQRSRTWPLTVGAKGGEVWGRVAPELSGRPSQPDGYRLCGGAPPSSGPPATGAAAARPGRSRSGGPCLPGAGGARERHSARSAGAGTIPTAAGRGRGAGRAEASRAGRGAGGNAATGSRRREARCVKRTAARVSLALDVSSTCPGWTNCRAGGRIGSRRNATPRRTLQVVGVTGFEPATSWSQTRQGGFGAAGANGTKVAVFQRLHAIGRPPRSGEVACDVSSTCPG